MAKSFNRHFQFLGSSGGAKPSGRLWLSAGRLRNSVWIIILLNVIALNQSVKSQASDNSNDDLGNAGLYFSAVDEDNEIVDGLTKQELELKIGGKMTEVFELSQVTGPISVGFLFDVSDSTRAFLDDGRKAALAMIQAGHPHNEYFAMAVHNRVDVLAKFSDGASVRGLISGSEYFAKSHGSFTLFYDAVSAALSEFSNAKHERRFLVIFSDGKDTRSKIGRSTLKEELLRSYVVIYGMELGDRDPYTSNMYLSSFCWESGGMLFRLSGLSSNQHYLQMLFRRNKRFAERRKEILTFEDYLEDLFESTMRSMNKQYMISFDRDDTSLTEGTAKVGLILRPSKKTKKKYKKIGLRYRHQGSRNHFFVMDSTSVLTSN